MSAVAQDIRYAVRVLWKSPSFAAVAVASLALGIGVNAAVFSLVSVVLLQPLPVPHPEQLVSMYTLDRTNPGFLSCSYPNYKDYRDRNTVFSGLLLFSSVPVILTGSSEPEELPAQIVSGNYFDVLGIKPVLGRAFVPEEDRLPGAQAVVVISYGFWTRRFAAARQAIGAAVSLNNRPYTIVGVAPKNFHGTNALVNADFWVPMMMYQQVFPMADWFDRRRALLFSPVGRLKPGVSRQQAEANIRSLAAQLEQAYPKDNQGRTVVLIPLAEALIHPNFRSTYMLGGGLALAASALVLLIACANVGNLLLVRAAGRRREVALRLALGVGRARLVAQFLTESTVLSLIGGAVALALARGTRDLLWNARPPGLLGGDAGLTLDGRVLGFTLLLSLITGTIFGLAPALRATRTDLATELRERRGPWTGGSHRLSLRSVLVMGQVALSVVALTGAGLFLRSLHNAQRIDPGFDAEHLATFSLDVKARSFSPAAGAEFYRRLLERLGNLPGVEAATLAGIAPFGIARSRSISIEGQEAAAGPGIVALIDSVEPRYFQTLRIPLLRGREFTDGDLPGAPAVSLVNETMARRFWSGKNPIGARLRLFGESAPVEIVGVVKDSTYKSLGEPPRLMVYLCLRQNYSPSVTVCVRTSGDPEALLRAVRREIHALDPSVLVSDAQTMRAVMHDSLWAPRLGAILFATFGALAGLLTVVGIYGVISYSVGQRTREMGIRMALGAQAGDVLRQVLAEGTILVAWGIVLGLCATVTLGGVLSTMLFGVSARDPLTLGAVILVLLATAWAACYVPALRATRIDPMTALRDE